MIDLAFIDAIHTPEFVEIQLGLVLERTRKGATVVLDDINFSASMRDYWKMVQKDPRFAAAFRIADRVGALEVAGCACLSVSGVAQAGEEIREENQL